MQKEEGNTLVLVFRLQVICGFSMFPLTTKTLFLINEKILLIVYLDQYIQYFYIAIVEKCISPTHLITYKELQHVRKEL